MPAPGANADAQVAIVREQGDSIEAATCSSRTSCAAIVPTTPRAGGESAAHPTARLARRWCPTSASCPGTSACARRCPAPDVFDVHTHIGANDPDGFSCTRAELVESLERVDAQRVRVPDARARRLPGRQRHGRRRGGRERRAPVRVLPARPAQRRRSPRRAAASTTAPAGSSSTRAPRASTSTTPTCRTCSPSPTSTGCRSSATPAAASRRWVATPIEVCSRYPGLRLILAHAGISDLSWIWREAPRPPQPLLRHRLVVAERPAGAVRARPARADPDGERRALRHAGLRRDDGHAPRAPGGPEPGRDARRARRPGAPAGRARGPARPRARAGDRVALARPAAGTRLLVPAERDRPDVRRRRSRRRRWRWPRWPATSAPTTRTRRSTRRSWRCSTRAPATTRPATAGPARFAPGLHLIIVAAALARTPDVPLPDEPLGFGAVGLG